MKRTTLAAALALSFVAMPASAAKVTVGKVEIEVTLCEVDEYFGRLAAWYYGVEFEGGALCG